MMNTERSAGQILRDVLRHRIFIISAGAVVFYTLTGFFLLPYIIEKTLPGSIQKNLNCTADVGSVRFNPFLFKLELDDFDLKEKTGAPVVGFDRLFVDFETSSLFRWAWTFQHLRLDNPRVNIAMAPDGNLNLTKLIPPGETETKTTKNGPDDEATPVRMLLHDIRINNGEITFTDNRISKPAVAKLTPLNLALSDISTLPEKKGPYSLAAKMPGGTEIRWTGEITLAPIQSTGLVEMSNISVETAWQFFQDTMRMAPPAGRIDVRTRYQFDLDGESPGLVLDGIDALLSGLVLHLEGNETPGIALEKLHLSDSRFDLKKQQLDIGKLLMADGRVSGTIGPDGQLQLQKMFKPQPGQTKKNTAATIEKQAPSSAKPARPWVVNLNKFLLDNIDAEYMDQRRDPAMVAGIDNIQVRFSARAQIGGAMPEIVVQDFSSRLGVISAGSADAEPDLRLDALLMEGGRFDLGAMQFTMDSVDLEGGHVNVVRGTDGAINLADLAPPPRPPAVVEEKPDIPETKGPELQFLIEHIDVKDVSTSFSDHTVQTDAPVIQLDRIHAALTGVDGKSPMAFSTGLEIKEGGQFTARGIIDPAGPVVQAEFELADLQIPTFQPYVNQYANIHLQSGTISTRGQFGFKGEDLKPAISFMGNMAMNDFWFSRPDFSEEQNGLKKLTVSKIDFKLSPSALHIADVQLIGSSGEIVIDESRKVNFALMAREQTPDKNKVEPSPAEGSNTATGFPVRIDRVKISDSKLEFSDLSLRPQFATRIHNLGGVVTGISTAPDTRAQLVFNGDVDKYGDAKISGEIAMAAPKRFTDITMAFRNIEMSNMTPYSGRFAGRRIDSGRLSLNLEYKIKNSQLLGDNKIVLDSLTLGDRVESPDAVSLPLDLAIAILEDEDGRIDIGLPVRGDLEDPEFSYGHLVWQALVNVIKKIVTAPFRALGGLFGDGVENPNSVVFAPGSTAVSAPEREKLDKLASVLTKRPGLQLIVQGNYSPEQDGNKLRKRRVLDKLSTVPGVALDPVGDLGPVDYTGIDTRKALREIFLESFAEEELAALVRPIAAQEKQEVAVNQDPPDATEIPDVALAQAIFNRLVETTPLPEAELTALAVSRADAVRAMVLKAGDLPPERFKAKAPESLPSGEAIAVTLSLETMN